MASKYFTGTGDNGDTGLLGNVRVPKSDDLIEAIGSVDELNGWIGLSLFYIRDDSVRKILRVVQNELFVIGASLAMPGAEKISKARLDDNAIIRLEEGIRRFGGRMPDLKQFVIPGGCEGSVHLHLARAVARRSERAVVAASTKRAANSRAVEKRVIAYLNRLSSLLFVLALYLNFIEGIDEEHPTY